MFKLLDTPVGKRFVEEGKLPAIEVEIKINQGTLLDVFAGMLVVAIVVVLLIKYIKL